MFLKVDRKKIFYFFLALVLLSHFFMFFFRINLETLSKTNKPNKAINLKLFVQKTKNLSFKKQVVQSEDSTERKESRDAYLSDKTRSFERETKARNIDIFQKSSLGESLSDGNQKSKGQFKKTNKNKVKKLKFSDLGVHQDFNDMEIAKATNSQKSKKGLKNGDINSTGISATNDYVEEVQLGDFTQLNTVEYKYYGFFHRIRQKLEQFWGKSIKEKSEAIFRSGRSIASEDYVTSLQVTLNEKGEIISVKVLGASGVKELDDAAIESFNQAGPFPNPPRGLIQNGRATIQWGFVVKS